MNRCMSKLPRLEHMLNPDIASSAGYSSLNKRAFTLAASNLHWLLLAFFWLNHSIPSFTYAGPLVCLTLTSYLHSSTHSSDPFVSFHPFPTVSTSSCVCCMLLSPVLPFLRAHSPNSLPPLFTACNLLCPIRSSVSTDLLILILFALATLVFLHFAAILALTLSALRLLSYSILSSPSPSVWELLVALDSIPFDCAPSISEYGSCRATFLYIYFSGLIRCRLVLSRLTTLPVRLRNGGHMSILFQ